jgi:PAS domain S-box-containing protein
MAISIPWHRRLEARALAGVTAVVGASLLAITVVTSEVVASHSLRRAEQDLATSQAAVTHLVASKMQLVSAETRLITGLPVFRAYMTDQRLVDDGPTMTAMVAMYREDLSAAFTIVTDRRGHWLATAGLPADPDLASQLESRTDVAAGGDVHSEILVLDGALHLLVAEPALFGTEVLGTLTAGFVLDDGIARELAQSAGRDVTLVAGTQLSGSSLNGLSRQRLHALLTQSDNPFRVAGAASLVQLEGDAYVGASFSLAPSAGGAPAAQLILLESWAATEAFIADIRTRLLWTGAAVFLLAVSVSLFLSRRMGRPLRRLAEVSAAIASGRGTPRLSPTGSAEAVAMAEAFNDMTASLSHWHTAAVDRAEQLQASYQRYYAVMHSVHDAIVSTDQHGAILFWHPRAEALFGYSENEAIGLLFSSLLAPGCQSGYASATQDLTRDTPDAPHSLTFGGEGIRRDGTSFPLELSLARWTSGEQMCLTAVIRDVTERTKGEELLRQRDQQLLEAQKMDAIGRLASGIAHDFNNSLMVIQGHSEMLMATMPEEDGRRKKVEVIVQAATGAAGITRRLLMFGRKHTADARVVDPGELVQETQKILARLLGDHIAVVADLGDEPGYIHVDPDQLEQALMNLAINARDAMPDGGEVRFEVRASGAFVTIAVRDTGCGMDSATAARIFEPFFTTKPADRGTGLGLSIVYGIVTQSGGRIDVETAPGRGTTILLHLPRVERNLETAAPPEVQSSLEPGDETVLIAEDKPLVRSVLRKALSAAGYRVLEAENGEQALVVARAYDGPIDLLLTDVVMPEMGGAVLSHALTLERPELRTVFMSGHPAGSVERAPVDASDSPCLDKPFSFDTLSRELRLALDADRAA